ncbi:chromate ion transporter [Gaeumannomyces tritici R3-111a-1]|uniref:Chromate ion transporter n=1 Tax=Gaeumannomyces tritici (strain R3-111a-1) TaxID=644352 RepID=J3P503_GAET3|nr:chromate ion transporter [Gaeumannomyces tritici R3-111a-1]EJT74751.1 chromate ion transporter [Gaeumannomyces tritici R3-111a-1]
MGVGRTLLSLGLDRLDERLWNTVWQNWYLGFTSFGGPPVHFKIFYDKFTTKLGWIEEQTYQELFSVCQAFSGPGSTKMHYCINLIHDGFIPATLGFLVWSLPGALGMYGLAVGVANIGQSLPRAVYALLSGLNAATVGIIALAAVQLAQKAITDKTTRILLFLGAAAGLLYNALWYFPLLMFAAGIAAVVHDYRWLHGPVKAVWRLATLQKLRGRGARAARDDTVEMQPAGSAQPENGGGMPTTSRPPTGDQGLTRRLPGSSQEAAGSAATSPVAGEPDSHQPESRAVPDSHQLDMSWQFGLFIIVCFFISFIVIMVLRGISLPGGKSILYSLFANMYLAGTIIFGGGPVVIPLLREYIVAEGWVSPRDFLVGLAIIQSFPGPNFNFAVYLGALTASNAGYNPAAGAVLGYLGIFLPGLITVHGTIGVWSAIRGLRWVKSGLRGVNAAAVGLIFTAVYRLWQIGWIDEGFQNGTSLADDPWWVVVSATSYVGGAWFGVNAPIAILFGAVLGLVRYGVISGS